MPTPPPAQRLPAPQIRLAYRPWARYKLFLLCCIVSPFHLISRVLCSVEDERAATTEDSLVRLIETPTTASTLPTDTSLTTPSLRVRLTSCDTCDSRRGGNRGLDHQHYYTQSEICAYYMTVSRTSPRHQHTQHADEVLILLLYYCNNYHVLLPVFDMTWELSSARVKDTLGHTSMPVFSVDCCLFCLFQGHANWLQISRYGVNPVQYRSSGSFWCMSPFAIAWLALVSCRFPCTVNAPTVSVFPP